MALGGGPAAAAQLLIDFQLILDLFGVTLTIQLAQPLQSILHYSKQAFKLRDILMFGK